MTMTLLGLKAKSGYLTLSLETLFSPFKDFKKLSGQKPRVTYFLAKFLALLYFEHLAFENAKSVWT
jgi:hypothetical protein